jgi:hypoxanthine phosphoribosyltransferase
VPLEVLIDAGRLRSRVVELAKVISQDFPTGVLLIAVLKGSVHFLSDLARELTVEAELDFMSVSSYGGQMESSGQIQILKDLDRNIEGRDVLIVEDIVDTGQTLAHLQALLLTRQPRSLKTVALLDKTEARKVKVPVDYTGFPLASEFVVGYGLDYGERFRNLPYIAIYRES